MRVGHRAHLTVCRDLRDVHLVVQFVQWEGVLQEELAMVILCNGQLRLRPHWLRAKHRPQSWLPRRACRHGVSLKEARDLSLVHALGSLSGGVLLVLS